MSTRYLKRVQDEADAAERKYGPFASAHEGYGVLAEEVAELLDAIRSNQRVSIEDEAIQVSAVALRVARCCRIGAFARRSGF